MSCFTGPININGQILVRAWITDAARAESEFEEMFADANPEKHVSGGHFTFCI